MLTVRPATADDLAAMAELRGPRLVGYADARVEPRDWNALLDAYAGLHDIFVDEDARRAGAGKALLDATLDALARQGVARVVLSTMWSNAAAQRLFERAGFRRTMVEMTCELGER